MNKNKYYKVKEITENSGKTYYKVFACNNRFALIFSMWDSYSFRNKTLSEAKEHIGELVKMKLKKSKTVFRRTVK